MPSATPPAAHGSQLAWVLRQPQFAWISADTPRLHLHAVEGSVAAGRLGDLGERAERIVDAHLAWLGEASYPRRLELVLLRSREDMRILLGSTPGGFAIAADDAALVVIDSAGNGPLRHELMHVLSWRAWGEPHGGYEGGAWISEGVATGAMGGCQDISFDRLAAGLQRAGTLPDIGTLVERFDHSRFESSVAVGSFVAHLRRTQGVASLRTLWREGPAAAPSATGRTLSQLESEWHAALGRVQPAALDPAAVRRSGCERA